MAHNSRRSKRSRDNLTLEDHQLLEAFEAEYARILEEEELAAAKAYFRENFMVSCPGRGYLGKTTPPLNCACCGLYLD